MITVKLVDKLSNVSDDLKWATNTHVTPFTLTFKAYLTIYMVLEDLFLLLNFFTCPPIFLPVHIRFARPNDGWTGLYIKAMLCTDLTKLNNSVTMYILIIKKVVLTWKSC